MQDSDFGAIAFIFARGGSKGVPGKNIKLLAGKPLIAHSIAVGLQTPGIRNVVVSTDDPAIAEVSRAFGAEVPFMRPADLAQDRSPEWLAWRHAIEWVQIHWGDFNQFVSLPATSPFRAVEDVTACMDALAADPLTDIVVTATEANRSPYFNMVTPDRDGYVDLVIKPVTGIARRQDAPAVYDLTTVAYAARPSFVLRAEGIFAGKVRAVTVPRERALDIDTPFDFQMAEALALARQ